MLTEASDRPRPRANYPLARQAGDFIFLSGTSSRRPDNTCAGAEADVMSTATLDIQSKTRGLSENMHTQLTDLHADLVDVACYLVSLNDFGASNVVYNSYFDVADEPTRTAVTVHQLPHPHVLVELRGTAFKPGD